MNNNSKYLLLIILLIACLPQSATDIYVPSLPAIALSLKASLSQTQWTLASFLFGLSISQLVYGPLSEGLGRLIPLKLGLCIMLLGSIVSLSANHIYILLLGRFIQGCGAGACTALFRSIFRDSFEGAALSKYGSILSIFVTFIIPAMPLLGGYIQETLGWRANFAFLALYVVITLAFIIKKLPETNSHAHKDRLQLAYIFSTYKQMLTSRIFMGYVIATFLSYGAFFAWFATGPILLIKHLGVTPVNFGWISLFIGAVAMFFGGLINAKFVLRMGMTNMLRIGWSIMAFAGFIMIISNILFGITLVSILISVFIFTFGTTFIWGNTFAGAFTPFGKIAGYAAALYGCMQIGGGAVLTSLMTHLPTNSELPLAYTYLGLSLSAWLIFEIMVKDIFNLACQNQKESI